MSQQPSDNEQLSHYVRRNLIRTLVGLLVLAAVLFVVGKLYEEEMLRFAERGYELLGAGGLLGAIFIADAIFSPVPPDVVLVVIAKSRLHESWAWMVPAVGVVSAIGGHAGWYIGGHCARFPWAAAIVERIRRQHEDTLRRFDRWAVFLGAITPIPFSVICITAGALGMPLSRLSPITLFRIPRYTVFYWVIYWSMHAA